MPIGIAIIVPTLGRREEYLLECLKSIRSAGNCHVLLIAPSSFEYERLINDGLVDQFEIDPGTGLASAINYAESKLPASVDFFNWLGDDDCLTPNSITIAALFLQANEIDFVWGSCIYIDEEGSQIGINRSGTWARYLMRFGPDLIPQPGALIRRELFKKIGGLNEHYKLAFDFDMFLNLEKLGKGKFIPQILSKYRWHDETLSAGSRLISVREARQVRMSHLPAPLKVISPLWEYPISWLTLWSGAILTVYAKGKRAALSIKN